MSSGAFEKSVSKRIWGQRLGATQVLSRNWDCSKRRYTLDLLQEIEMLGCKATNAPIESTKQNTTKCDNSPTYTIWYQSLVEKLIYLTYTRPNIGFVVSMASRQVSNPHMPTWNKLGGYFNTLKGTLGRGLYFNKNPNNGVEVYKNSNWADCATNRRSTTWYCSFA